MSSLANHGRELRDEVMNLQAQATLVGTEMAQAQQCSLELEKIMVEIVVQEQ